MTNFEKFLIDHEPNELTDEQKLRKVCTKFNMCEGCPLEMIEGKCIDNFRKWEKANVSVKKG